MANYLNYFYEVPNLTAKIMGIRIFFSFTTQKQLIICRHLV